MPQASENTGIRMTILRDFAGHWITQTIYSQRDRRRIEFRNYLNARQKLISGPRLVGIMRCDLGKAFELNLDVAEYVSSPYPPKSLTRAEMDARGFHLEAPVSGEPTLRIEITTLDTGERKNIFGRLARRVIITRKEIPLESSQREFQESTTDGWYIDFDFDLTLSCEPKLDNSKGHHAFAAFSSQPQEIPEFVDFGEPEKGFAVQLDRISNGATHSVSATRRQTKSTRQMLVTDLELGPLDPALFEVPSHFKLVEQIERSPNPRASSALWQNFKSRLDSFLRL